MKKMKNASNAESQKIAPLMKIFASDDNLAALTKELHKRDGDPVFRFASHHDGAVKHLMMEEMIRRVDMAVAEGTVAAIGIVYRRASFRCDGETLHVDLPGIRKEASRLKKDNPDLISCSIVFPTALGDGLLWQAAIVGLLMTNDPDRVPRSQGPTTIGVTCLPEDHWKVRPSGADVRDLLRRFSSAASTIRRLNDRASRERSAESWKKLRGAAVAQCALADLLSPVKKVFDGAGSGAEILEHALTGPEQRTKRAGKAGLTREELVDLIWRHALTHNLPAPPMVKI